MIVKKKVQEQFPDDLYPKFYSNCQDKKKPRPDPNQRELALRLWKEKKKLTKLLRKGYVDNVRIQLAEQPDESERKVFYKNIDFDSWTKNKKKAAQQKTQQKKAEEEEKERQKKVKLLESELSFNQWVQKADYEK